ncbi:hypothetical protein O181_022367 [Austropuccinia psidii MF-1]|uniref:Uncharacterized protein n=1 Tax=Austropuccinia psidii MF-1 TaxID=1389203 RepID=A0A9Q3GX23_9BASI|nr:hypothetical protein [Austropuccinia psidii MF-1]
MAHARHTLPIMAAPRGNTGPICLYRIPYQAVLGRFFFSIFYTVHNRNREGLPAVIQETERLSSPPAATWPSRDTTASQDDFGHETDPSNIEVSSKTKRSWNPNKKPHMAIGTLDKYVKNRQPKKPLCPESLKTALVYFVADSDLPLSISESRPFQALLELCHPGVQNILVRRTALTAHVSNVFFFHQQHLREILSPTSTAISFTTDVWTSPNVIAFMGVTAHVMSSDFKLTSILIGLHPIEGPHSGAALAEIFMKVLGIYNLKSSIICITTDNASVNSRMASEIQDELPGFCADQQAIGCMAHTIHLAAQDGLKALGATPDTNDSHGLMSITNITNDPDGLHLNYNSIVSRISRLATYLNQSPQRREKFITTVHLVYDDSRPTKAVTLLSHVSTRWNSTYEMLNRAWTLKDAYHHFCSTLNLQSYQLSAIEWEKVKVMIDFLHPLHEATHIICGSKYPTINHALPLYILLIKRIQQACQQYDVAQIEPAAEAMINKLTKYLRILLLKTPIICSTILDP